MTEKRIQVRQTERRFAAEKKVEIVLSAFFSCQFVVFQKNLEIIPGLMGIHELLFLRFEKKIAFIPVMSAIISKLIENITNCTNYLREIQL